MRVIWSTLMARSRLMMTTLQLRRIFHHQKTKEELMILLIVDEDMMEYAVVVKPKATIQMQNYSILAALLVSQHCCNPLN